MPRRRKRMSKATAMVRDIGRGGERFRKQGRPDGLPLDAPPFFGGSDQPPQRPPSGRTVADGPVRRGGVVMAPGKTGYQRKDADGGRRTIDLPGKTGRTLPTGRIKPQEKPKPTEHGKANRLPLGLPNRRGASAPTRDRGAASGYDVPVKRRKPAGG